MLESRPENFQSWINICPASWEAQFDNLVNSAPMLLKQCTDAAHKSATSEGMLRVYRPTSAAESAVEAANRRGVVWQNEGF